MHGLETVFLTTGTFHCRGRNYRRDPSCFLKTLDRALRPFPHLFPGEDGIAPGTEALNKLLQHIRQRHAVPLSASTAGAIGSMPESTSILRIMQSRPSWRRAHQLGELILKLRTRARVPGVRANVTLISACVT